MLSNKLVLAFSFPDTVYVRALLIPCSKLCVCAVYIFNYLSDLNFVRQIANSAFIKYMLSSEIEIVGSACGVKFPLYKKLC